MNNHNYDALQELEKTLWKCYKNMLQTYDLMSDAFCGEKIQFYAGWLTSDLDRATHLIYSVHTEVCDEIRMYESEVREGVYNRYQNQKEETP
jgi:hypothetical protein